jgi:hypothetical protein
MNARTTDDTSPAMTPPMTQAVLNRRQNIASRITGKLDKAATAIARVTSTPTLIPCVSSPRRTASTPTIRVAILATRTCSCSETLPERMTFT